MKKLVVSAAAERAFNAESVSIRERDCIIEELHPLLVAWSFEKSEIESRRHAVKLDCLPLLLQFRIDDTEICLEEVISLQE